MDFLSNQAHPENDEVACTHYALSAQPLVPAVLENAVTCACAYMEGQYHLLVVPEKAPETVALYLSAAITGFKNPVLTIRLSAPVRSVSFFLKPEEPLICILSDALFFYDLKGNGLCAKQTNAQWATALWDRGQGYLVTQQEVYELQADLSPCDEGAYSIEAVPCLVDNRTDILWQTGRSNPGTLGGMLFRFEENLYYTCGDPFNRCASDHMDTFICQVHDLGRPYSRRYLAIPNGGAACFFTGENGRLFAAFVGATPLSCVYQKAAILPMDLVENQFFRPSEAYYLETTPVARLKPKKGVSGIRDPFVYAAPDGCYYLIGTTPGPEGSYLNNTSCIRMWRSEDLETFTPLGKVYDYRDTPQAWQNNVSQRISAWAPEMVHYNQTYYLTYSTSPGCGLLKSTSGRPEGPYMDLGRVVQRGIDSGFFMEDGQLYLIWQNGRIAPLSPDGTEMTREPVLLLPTDGQEVGYEGAGLIKVDSHYVLYGAEWHGDFRIDGSYDMMYSVADHLMGPYSPRRLLVPHGGHGCLFWGHDGVLRYALFGNDRTAPFRRRLGIGPVHIQKTVKGLTLEI